MHHAGAGCERRAAGVHADETFGEGGGRGEWGEQVGGRSPCPSESRDWLSREEK